MGPVLTNLIMNTRHRGAAAAAREQLGSTPLISRSQDMETRTWDLGPLTEA